jgi:hypothetical protein
MDIIKSDLRRLNWKIQLIIRMNDACSQFVDEGTWILLIIWGHLHEPSSKHMYSCRHIFVPSDKVLMTMITRCAFKAAYVLFFTFKNKTFQLFSRCCLSCKIAWDIDLHKILATLA